MRKSMKLMITALVLGFTMVCGSVSAMAEPQFKLYRVARDANSKDVYIVGRISREAVADTGNPVTQIGFGVAKSASTAETENSVSSDKVFEQITYNENGDTYDDENYYYYGARMDKEDINNFYISAFTAFDGGTTDYDEPVQFYANETEIVK